MSRGPLFLVFFFVFFFVFLFFNDFASSEKSSCYAPGHKYVINN